MGGKRAVIRVQLDLRAKRQLDDLCDKRGMTQIAVMSRLVDWFVAQDEVVQAWVLASLSRETLAPMARKLLEDLSGGPAADGNAN